jgi:regulator of RNase E activity RraA
MTPLSSETRERLMAVSTATLATILFKRGLRSQFIQGVPRLSSKPLKMVGPAFTLRYIPAREDIDTIDVFRDPEHPQRKAIETVPPGHVLVMDCRGDHSAASAGGILATRAMIRGCAGIVTDGGLRDADEIAELDMPTYCASRSAPTNLTRHHAVDLNVPIGCGTAPVFPDDIMVGDGDGVIVLPRGIADEVALEGFNQDKLESFVLDEIRKGAPLRGTYPPSEETLKRFKASLGDTGSGSGAI